MAEAFEFWIKDEGGILLDAVVELSTGSLVLQSRGGAKGEEGTRNQDYSPALRLILTRLMTSRRTITGAWVDSSRVQDMPFAARQILSASEFPIEPGKAFTLMGKRMEGVGQAPGADPAKGNRSK